MYCPKCHTKLEKDMNFCHNCGSEINSSWEQETEDTINMHEIPNNNDMKDYIKEYIGTNAEWIEKQYFSIWAAFFGPFYLLMRKLWTHTIVLMVLDIISYMYIPESLGILFRVGVNIVFAIMFKDIYLKEVEKRVQTIQKENPNYTSKEILEECRKKGGTIHIGIIIVLFMIYLIAVGILTTTTTKEKPKDINESIQIKEMKYKITNTMKEKNSYSNYRYYVDRKTNGTCYITITITKSNLSTKDYIQDNTSGYDSYVEKDIKEVSIKDVQGHNFTMTTGSIQKDIYALKYKETIYDIKLEDTNYTYNNCGADRDYILNSITWE